MRKELFKTADCVGLPVRYYLLTEATGGETPVFGAAVEYGEERVLLRDLSVSRRKIERLLESMARGTVTPVTAKDVAEDWLAD